MLRNFFKLVACQTAMTLALASSGACQQDRESKAAGAQGRTQFDMSGPLNPEQILPNPPYLGGPKPALRAYGPVGRVGPPSASYINTDINGRFSEIGGGSGGAAGADSAGNPSPAPRADTNTRDATRKGSVELSEAKRARSDAYLHNEISDQLKAISQGRSTTLSHRPSAAAQNDPILREYESSRFQALIRDLWRSAPAQTSEAAGTSRGAEEPTVGGSPPPPRGAATQDRRGSDGGAGSSGRDSTAGSNLSEGEPGHGPEWPDATPNKARSESSARPDGSAPVSSPAMGASQGGAANAPDREPQGGGVGSGRLDGASPTNGQGAGKRATEAWQGALDGRVSAGNSADAGGTSPGPSAVANTREHRIPESTGSGGRDTTAALNGQGATGHPIGTSPAGTSPLGLPTGGSAIAQQPTSPSGGAGSKESNKTASNGYGSGEGPGTPPGPGSPNDTANGTSSGISGGSLSSSNIAANLPANSATSAPSRAGAGSGGSDRNVPNGRGPAEGPGGLTGPGSPEANGTRSGNSGGPGGSSKVAANPRAEGASSAVAEPRAGAGGGAGTGMDASNRSGDRARGSNGPGSSGGSGASAGSGRSAAPGNSSRGGAHAGGAAAQERVGSGEGSAQLGGTTASNGHGMMERSGGAGGPLSGATPGTGTGSDGSPPGSTPGRATTDRNGGSEDRSSGTSRSTGPSVPAASGQGAPLRNASAEGGTPSLHHSSSGVPGMQALGENRRGEDDGLGDVRRSMAPNRREAGKQAGQSSLTSAPRSTGAGGATTQGVSSPTGSPAGGPANARPLAGQSGHAASGERETRASSGKEFGTRSVGAAPDVSMGAGHTMSLERPEFMSVPALSAFPALLPE